MGLKNSRILEVSLKFASFLCPVMGVKEKVGETTNYENEECWVCQMLGKAKLGISYTQIGPGAILKLLGNATTSQNKQRRPQLGNTSDAWLHIRWIILYFFLLVCQETILVSMEMVMLIFCYAYISLYMYIISLSIYIYIYSFT